ncbi:MAG: hypothetical protein ACK4OH_14350 [Acidovorax temperans]|uniref:hypothetical protein n=1 Tax=Acidovorax temperans TaxID=80878 RepID=UPI00391D8466
MTTAQDPIAHAARLLREAAEELRQEHAFPGIEGWANETDAKAAYDEHLAAAQALEDWEAAVGAGGVQALSAAPAIGDELRDTLVAVSAAIAERDDRAAQKMICEILAASTTPPAEQHAANKAAPECATCNDQGAVGNILNAEPCPDCTATRGALRQQAAPKAAPGEPIKRGKWAWLPVEPSTAMLIAGNHGQPGDFSALKVWQDMIAALDRSADYTRPLDPPTEAAPQQEAQDATVAAFEAVRKKLCTLPRYSFVLDDDGLVRRAPDRTGNWIEFDEAHALFDPVSVEAALAAQGGK